MDNPKEIKKEKDDPSKNASSSLSIRRGPLPFGIVDLTSDDDERQVLTFRTNLGTPIESSTTFRQNDQTVMKAVTPISCSSSIAGAPELKDALSLSSDNTQHSMETMSVRGNDSHDNNQKTTNEESDDSDDGLDEKAIINRLMSKPRNGKTQFSRHDGAKKFVDTTGSFPKGSLGFSHFESYKVALECLNAVIGKKENTCFSISNSGCDSSGILYKDVHCMKNGRQTKCERRIKIVELHSNDWVVILGSKKHTCVCKKRSCSVGSTKSGRCSKRTKTNDDRISTEPKVGGRKKATRASVARGTKEAPPSSVSALASTASLSAGVQAQVSSIAEWIETEVFKGILPDVATAYAHAFVEHGLFSPDMISEYFSTDVFNQEGPLKDVFSENHKTWFMMYLSKRNQGDNP